MCKNTTSTSRTRKWRSNNRSRHNQYMREYRHQTIADMMTDPNEIWFETDARKRKLMQTATPPWADRDRIRAIYRQCMEATARYPHLGFVVHHTIPISHRKVCGLHVAENLKIVSAKLKAGMGRKFV